MDGLDACVYSKIIGSDCIFIRLYVNDMLMFSVSLDAIEEIKRFLSSKFEMKDWV